MSGQATGWVLRHGPKDRVLRLVLLTIADAANRDGAHAHPGMQAICEGSLYGKSHVHAALRKLIEQGWLEIEEQGNGRGNATVYRIPGVSRETVQPADPLPEGNRPLSNGKPSNPAPETVQSGAASLCSSTVENNGTEQRAELALVDLPEVVRSSPYLGAARELCHRLEEGLVERGYAVAGHAEQASWVKPMELMLRKDGRDAVKVARMIEMLHLGDVKPFDFWQTNVLCPATLRARYARIAEQYAAQRRGASRNPALHAPGEPTMAEILSWRDTRRDGSIDVTAVES